MEGAVGFDLSTMHFDDRQGQRETKPRSSAASYLIRAPKPFEDARQIFTADSVSGVPDFEDRACVIFPERYTDCPTFGRVLDGVVDEQHQQPPEHYGISAN